MPDSRLEKLAAVRPYVDSGILPTLQSLAKEMTAPFWWCDPRLPLNERVVGGGTMCFVNTGQTLLGITAAHIHRAVISARQERPWLWTQVGGHVFDPDRNLHDIDDDLDIAVYRFSKIELDGTRAFAQSARHWPPAQDEKQPYFVCGWLWHLADSKGAETDHKFLHFIAKLTDSTDRSLVVQVKPSTSVQWGTEGLTPGTNLGGMSGGPIYRWDEFGITGLHLVGVISEYHEGMEFVRGRPLSLVTAEGLLAR